MITSNTELTLATYTIDNTRFIKREVYVPNIIYELTKNDIIIGILKND